MNTNIVGIAYVELYVGNLFQASHFYKNSMGFTPVQVNRGNTTRDQSSILLKQQDINLILTSALSSNSLLAKHVHDHGDGVKDIAFSVNNIEKVVEEARAKGGKIVKEIWTESDEHGSVKMACIQTVK